MGRNKLTRTGNPEFQTSRYCYYYVEDGECSLNNPIIWKRLCLYVQRLIKFTFWIENKNFIDPSDILLAVQEEIKHLHPSMYGNEYQDAITFLIKKINTQTGREWWKYLKTQQPARYGYLREKQKQYNRKQRLQERSYVKNATSIKRTQKQMIDNLSEGYLIQQVYNDFKNKTGVRYTFKEIREHYPQLIEEKRQTIIKKRSLK